MDVESRQHVIHASRGMRPVLFQFILRPYACLWMLIAMTVSGLGTGLRRIRLDQPIAGQSWNGTRRRAHAPCRYGCAPDSGRLDHWSVRKVSNRGVVMLAEDCGFVGVVLELQQVVEGILQENRPVLDFRARISMAGLLIKR